MKILRKLVYPFLGIILSANSIHASKDPDYIIVGLGTAGAVLARYLSDPDPISGQYKNSVVVLEAGQNYSQDPAVTAGPLTNLLYYDELVYNPKYAITSIVPESNPLAGLVPSIQFSMGRQWFGTSSHNGMDAVRGSSDYWNTLATSVGSSQWSYNNLLPLMKSLETYTGTSTQPALRGVDGVLKVSQAPPLVSTAYANNISAVTGIPIVSDYNVPDGNLSVANNQSYSSTDFTQRSWAYDFLPTTLLSPDGEGQSGRQLTVQSGAFVNRVIFKGTEAIGVEYCSGDPSKKTETLYAKKKIILCAGCPFSAAILQRSGIGSTTVLNTPEVNIPQVFNQPLVGTGLKTHLGVFFGATQPTNPANQLLDRINIFADGRNFFAPAGTGDGIRRFQSWIYPFFALPAPIASALNYPTGPGIFGFCFNLQQKSSGTAYIIDNSPFTFPGIRFNFYTDGGLENPNSDLSAAVALLKTIKAIVDNAGPGSEMIYPPASHFASDAILAQDVGAFLSFSQFSVAPHFCGTCQMGSDSTTGVVSSDDLHVFGVTDLMVADNSIYPLPPSGNTAWAAYLAGLMAAKALGCHVAE